MGGGAETPEELEFEDDDGTVYVWDARLRKYVAKVREGGDELVVVRDKIG